MLGQLNIRMQKKEVGTFMLTLGMKINSKWITDLNGRARTIDTIKKSEKTTHNTCCNMAKKIDELAFIKIKTFCHQRTLSRK